MKFDQAIEHILKLEGGLIDHPKDPGGLTNFGIAQKYHPDVDIRNLTKDQAKAIYYREYYQRIGGDSLPEKIRLAALDCAINQGANRCVRMLQQCVDVKIDGYIGPKTFEALQKAPQDALLKAFIYLRLKRYKVTENADVFLKGWTNRLTDVALASGITADDLKAVYTA